MHRPYPSAPSIALARAPTLACILALAGAGGCEVAPVTDYLQVDFPSAIEVDDNCRDGGCEEAEALDVEVTWKDDGTYVDDSEVVIHEYRIDYESPDLDEEIPYFAGYTEQHVAVGETAEFSIPPLGNVQRQLFEDLIPSQEIYTITGRVTFAGWDPSNEPIEFPNAGSGFTMTVGNYSNLTLENTNTVVTGTTTTSGN